LTSTQQQHIKLLKNNKYFIILNTNKNLGPCIMEQKEYIQNILHEHLKNDNDNNDTYTQLQTDAAFKKLHNIASIAYVEHSAGIVSYVYFEAFVSVDADVEIYMR
jgi:glucosamine 6-phosphate synthetase-like amidotransferase/phosphosugar isomerase protein